MPKIYRKASGVWTEVKPLYVKIAGTWQQIAAGYVKVGGAWQKIYEPLGVPSAPQSLSASSIDTQGCNLSWSAPASDGGSSIAQYKIYRAESSSGPWTHRYTVTAPTTTYHVTDVSSGTYYWFKVTAVNAQGEGSESNTQSIYTTASNPPLAPSITSSAGSPTYSYIKLTVTKNASGGIPTHYDVYYRRNGSSDAWTMSTFAYSASPQDVSVPVLRTNMAHEFYVKARNADGTSAGSNSAYYVSGKGFFASSSDTGYTPAADSGSSAVGVGLNTASIGFNGVPYGSGGPYSIDGYSFEHANLNGEIMFRGDGSSGLWDSVTVYKTMDDPSSRTVFSSECSYTNNPGQYSKWTGGGSFSGSAGQGLRIIFEY